MKPTDRLFGLVALFALMLIPCITHSKSQVDFGAVVAQIDRAGSRAIEQYTPEQGLETADQFSDIYFDIFEASGMEQAIGLVDGQRKTLLESQFSAVIGAASSSLPKPDVANAWNTLRTSLFQVAVDFDKKTASGFWESALQSFLILVREGFEAMLVITALAAYLRKVGAADKLRVLYQAVIWALVASAITAYLLSMVFRISGAGQEALEGITMLIASLVLFYVSYWLIAKREAERWQAYVKQQIDKALSRGSLMALGLAAFLAVYREGAETVLFYQALLGQSEGQETGILTGFAAACVVLGVIYIGMRSAAFRLPLGIFFTVTAILLYYLAISFAGNGILELQEAGWVSITPAPGVPSLPWIGLFPSWEGIAVQIGLIVPALVAMTWWWMRRQQLQQAANR